MAGTNLAVGGVGSITGMGGQVAIPSSPNGVIRALCSLKTSGRLSGSLIRARFVIRLSPAVSSIATFTVYYNSGVNTDTTTFAGDIAISTFALGTVANLISGVFYLDLSWDPVSTLLQGYSVKNFGGTTSGPTTLAASPTFTDIRSLQLFCTINFTTIDSGHIAYLVDSAMDQY